MKRIGLVTLVLALALTAMACNLTGQIFGSDGAAQVDEVATSVAGTLTASAPQATETPEAQLPTVEPTAPAATEAAPTETPSTEAPAALPHSGPGELRVAFVDGSGQLYALTESGGAQIAATGDVTSAWISPDGERIAYARRGSDWLSESLWIINFDGGDNRVLISAEDFAAMPRADGVVSTGIYQAQWVPGTNTLALSTQPLFEGPGWISNEDLILIDAISGERQTRFASGEGGGHYVFSPDGTQMAVVGMESIGLVNVDGGNPRMDLLTYTGVLTYSEYAYYATPVWAPDSSYLRVAIPPAEGLSEPTPPTTLWRIAVDGSPAVQEGSIVTSPLMFPVYSPDLTRLAYTVESGAPDQNLRQLLIAAPDGGDPQVYTTDSLIFKEWSPSSREFIYQVGSMMVLGRVEAMSMELSDTGSAVDEKWVDENRFLFLSLRDGGGYELRLGQTSVGSQLLAVSEGDNWPTYSFTK